MTTSFASDNWSGVHPEALAAIIAANAGHAPAYGGDELTRRATALLERELGPVGGVSLVLTGTAANVVALQCLLRPHEAVIAASSAHLQQDEAGAPERFLGSKVLTVKAPHGKLAPELLETLDWRIGDVHRVQPRVVTVSQPTELGVCYTLAELRTLIEYAHERGLLVHMDGARLANAAVALGCSLGETSLLAGVDALSFGGTKNGLLAAEAVIVRDRERAALLPYVRKQAMQLVSKLRFVSAQFEALLTDELWRRNATRANNAASRLAAGVSGQHEVTVTHPPETNAVFVTAPRSALERVRQRFPFDDWDRRTGEVRWMTSWDTQPGEVDAFLECLAAELALAG